MQKLHLSNYYSGVGKFIHISSFCLNFRCIVTFSSLVQQCRDWRDSAFYRMLVCTSVSDINFFCGYLVFKVIAKLTYLVAILGGHVTAWLPPIIRLMIKQNSIWSKALLMPLTIWNCVCLTMGRVSSVKIGLFFQEIIFRTEFPGSDSVLPTF